MNARVEDEWPIDMKPGRVEMVNFLQPTLDKIAGAFAAAQAEMHNPAFDSANPHFKSKFASLAAVRNAVIPVMAKNGICVAQDLTNLEGAMSCVTILTHSSGQQMRFGPLIIPTSKSDAHGIGSASTYAKRFALMAVMGVAGDDDDDGNASVGKPTTQAYEAPHKPQGDMGKNVPADVADKAAIEMRDILESDVDEDVKCLHVADKHDALNKDQELYVAAAGCLTAKERAAWKTYRDMAKKRAAAEPSSNGKRF